jgi:hypothetical protein
MLTFFEMHNLLNEADWRSLFNTGPAPVSRPAATGQPAGPEARPTTTPVQTHGTAFAGSQVEPPTPPPRSQGSQLNPAIDPHARLGQRDKQNISKNMKIPYKVGLNQEPINNTDYEQNRAANADKDRDAGPGYLNPLASKLLKQIESSPNVFQKGEPYTLDELKAIFAPSLDATTSPRELIAAIFDLSNQGEYGPFKKVSSIGMGGKATHSFVYNPPKSVPVPKMGGQASRRNASPDEEQNVLNPYGRQINKARQGGFANKVGRGVTSDMPTDRSSMGLGTRDAFDPKPKPGEEPVAAPREPGAGTPIEAAVAQFQRAQDALNGMLDGSNPNHGPTQARGLYMKMQELLDDAKTNYAQLTARGLKGDKAEELEGLIKGMEMELKDFPADIGLTDDKTDEYKPAVKRRRLSHDQAMAGMDQSRPKYAAPRDELDDELDAQYPHTAQKREWAYYRA